MFEVNINSKYTYAIDKERDGLTLDKEPVTWDKVTIKDQQFSILWNNANYEAEVVDFDRSTKSLDIKVNGNLYKVQVQDPFDQLLKKLGLDMASSVMINEVKAPMPGLVLGVKVEAGQEVKKDDALMVLEAMKMENVLKSPGDGTVKKVLVKAGDAVEKNAVLIEFE